MGTAKRGTPRCTSLRGFVLQTSKGLGERIVKSPDETMALLGVRGLFGPFGSLQHVAGDASTSQLCCTFLRPPRPYNRDVAGSLCPISWGRRAATPSADCRPHQPIGRTRPETRAERGGARNLKELGWHDSSISTCLMRPRLFINACFVVSRTII